MIREDYILAWIKRYVQWMTELFGFVKKGEHEAAIRRIELALRELLDAAPDSVIRLTDGEILARLTLTEPPQLVQEKCVILAVALKNLGLICAAKQEEVQSRDCFLKALHVVLGLKLRGQPVHLIEYAPQVPELVELLKPGGLDARTWATLMIHYEQQCDYARAEDALWELVEVSNKDPGAIEAGMAFYNRLLTLSDEALAIGNLSRAEAEAGLAELRLQSRQA